MNNNEVTKESKAKNTIYNIQLIDAEAFKYALLKQSNIDDVTINPDDNNLLIRYSRYAMDGNGYHVGYENVIFEISLIEKSELQLSGIPYLLSPYVINPKLITIKSKDLPNEELPTIDSHDNICEYHNPKIFRLKCIELNDYFPDCGCLDFFDGYSHSDDDFFFQDIDHLIEWAIEHDLPEAEFDSSDGNRIWSIGDDCEYDMDFDKE